MPQECLVAIQSFVCVQILPIDLYSRFYPCSADQFLPFTRLYNHWKGSICISSAVQNNTHSALERVFALSISCHRSPMRLVRRKTIIANALWLPWLIESLEEEHVVAPAHHTAYGLSEVGLRVLSTGFGITKIRSTCRLLECVKM